MAMEKRLELELRGSKPSEVTCLTLDNCRSFTMDCLKKDFVSLESLSLMDTGLSSLEGFPSLPMLKNLELGDNRIVDGLEHLLVCPKLVKLHLGGNKIKELSALDPLKEMSNLKSLDLFGCPVMRHESSRDKVFDKLPQLEALDGLDRENMAVPETDDEDTNDEEDGENDIENDVPSFEDEDEAEDEEEELDEDFDDDEDDDEEEEDDDAEDANGGSGPRGLKRKLEQNDDDDN